MNNRSGCAVGRKCCAYFFCLCFIVSALLAGCKRADRFEPLTAAVLSEDQFGDVLLDLQEIDLVYGDSIDLAFSGGYSVKSIPFYPDFYGTGGDTVLTDFYDQLAVAGIGCSFNEAAGVKEGETVTITLDERGKYRKEFEAYYVDPDITKWEGQTDEAFRNAREVTAGDIAEGILYRGSSPFDHSFHRVELMDAFLQEHRIQCVLDLSDTEETLAALGELPEYTAEMIKNGSVISCPLGIVYSDPESMRMIADGLSAMVELDGPYLIQCSLGRDRTGVLIALLEALSGAGYDEIISDYMESYRNLHNINMDADSLQYRLFKQRIDEKLEETLSVSRAELSECNLQSAAADYFFRCGMTAEEVAHLTAVLDGSGSAHSNVLQNAA